MLAPGVRSTCSPRATYASKSFWRNVWARSAGVAVASARATTVILTVILVSESDSEHDVAAWVERELLVAAQETAVAHVGRVADCEIDVANPAEQRPHEAGREIEQRVTARWDVEGVEAGLPRRDLDLGARVGAVGPASRPVVVQLGAERRARCGHKGQGVAGRAIGAPNGIRAGVQPEQARDFHFDRGLAAHEPGIRLLVPVHAQGVRRRDVKERVRGRDVDEPPDRVAIGSELGADVGLRQRAPTSTLVPASGLRPESPIS